MSPRLNRVEVRHLARFQKPSNPPSPTRSATSRWLLIVHHRDNDTSSQPMTPIFPAILFLPLLVVVDNRIEVTWIRNEMIKNEYLSQAQWLIRESKKIKLTECNKYYLELARERKRERKRRKKISLFNFHSYILEIQGFFALMCFWNGFWTILTVD